MQAAVMPRVRQPMKLMPKLQSWILFSIGVLAIALLFYFGYDEDISKRVALALAAAAIASYIPGLLQVNSSYVRASGALGVLVLVLFAEDVSRSFAPSSRAPGMPSNVKLNKDQIQYQSEIASAQFEISQGNFQTAVETLEHARKLKPGDQLALHMLGNLYVNHLQNYTRAAHAFEEGYKVGGSAQGRFAYNAAFARDAIGQNELAKEWIDRAYEVRASLRDDYPALWHDITFNRGLFYLIGWVPDGTPQQNKIFEAAVFSFHEFLNAGAPVSHWADYHLACLHANVAAHDIARRRPAQDALNKATEHFEKFVRRLQGFADADKQTYHRELAKHVLSEHGSGRRYLRRPGEAVSCPIIRRAWEAAGRDWADVVRNLALPEPPPVQATRL